MNYQKGIVNVILLIAVVVLAGLVGYFYAKDTAIAPPYTPTPQFEQKPTTPKPTPVSDTSTYTNTDLGISFSYPKAWGNVIQETEKGCFYSSSKVGCDNIKFAFQYHKDFVFSSASNSFLKDPNPRGGSFLDTFFIKSQADITNFCANRDTASCEVTTNKNGAMYVKALLKSCSEVACETNAYLYYYMKLSSKTFSGIAFGMQPGDKEAMAVVDTVKFVQN